MSIARAAADSIPYYTVFNVVDGYPRWTGEIVFSVAGLALAIALVAQLSGWIRMPRPIRSGVALGLLFLVLVMLPAHLIAHRDWAAMRDAVRAGRFTVVEGHVEDFSPPVRSRNLKQRETFKVYSHKQTFRYRYLESEIAPGFNTPSDRDGPIYAGLRVRIADVGGRIARLEIAPSGHGKSPRYIEAPR